MTAIAWRQIQRDNFTRVEQLLDFLEFSEDLRKKVLSSPKFPLNVPLRLAAKMAKNTIDDPIFRQFVPLTEETLPSPGFTPEPLEDQTFRKTKKILKKYKGRALFVSTGACAMNCRFCFRQNFPYEPATSGFDEEIAFIAGDPTITEAILSGGDPLSLSDETLGLLFRSLNQIPHLQRIRFHSRFPVGIPERINESFLKILASSPKQVFFIIHCNHPKELDADVIASLKKMMHLGIPVLNQSVLLKGVNDDGETLLALSEALVNCGVTPYYLHELDKVTGTSHFALPPERGPELIRYLQERLSGYGVPRLVREEPGYPSKTFISS